jgi:error-prone DNA polymerase
VKSDMVSPFLRRNHGLEAPTYAHPALRPTLQESHGVVVYHEQLMRVISVVTGCDLAEADRVRRHLDDDPDNVEHLHDHFVRRGIERGFAPEDAERIWKEVVAFASFGFCKAHAAAFAVPTYQSAWLKAHYPAHFLAGVLTHEPGMYPRRLILEDARHHDIEILPLDVNHSEPDYSVERTTAEGGVAPGCPDGYVRLAPPSAASSTPGAGPLPADGRYGIRLALKDVHGISDAEIRSILEARADRAFADVGDFLRRTNVSRPVAEALAHAGAFDRLPGGSRRDRLFVAMTADAPREGEQSALPLGEAAAPLVLRGYTDAEAVKAELEVVGMDASRHLLSFYRPVLDDLGVTPSIRLGDLRGETWVMVAGVKVASQTPAVRSGQRIIFLTLDDGTGLCDVTVFERVQAWCAKPIFHGFLLAVWGRLRRTGVRGVSVVAERAWDLAVLSTARRDGRLAQALAEGGPVPDQEARPAGRPEAPAGMGALVPEGHGMAARPLPKLWHASGGSAGR